MSTTIYLKDVSDRDIYHPILRLQRIEGYVPVIPKVGDIVDQWGLETLVHNGVKIVIEPKNWQESQPSGVEYSCICKTLKVVDEYCPKSDAWHRERDRQNNRCLCYGVGCVQCCGPS